MITNLLTMIIVAQPGQFQAEGAKQSPNPAHDNLPHHILLTTHYPLSNYSLLTTLHYHSNSVRGDSPSTIHNSHSSSIQLPRTTHHSSPATHGPLPGTHYPLLTGLYLPRLAPLSFIARSQQTFLRRPARRWRPKKIPSAPPRPALRCQFFYFYCLFMYFNLKI